jgi:hypothetical protein
MGVWFRYKQSLNMVCNVCFSKTNIKDANAGLREIKTLEI